MTKCFFWTGVSFSFVDFALFHWIELTVDLVWFVLCLCWFVFPFICVLGFWLDWFLFFWLPLASIVWILPSLLRVVMTDNALSSICTAIWKKQIFFCLVGLPSLDHTVFLRLFQQQRRLIEWQCARSTTFSFFELCLLLVLEVCFFCLGCSCCFVCF